MADNIELNVGSGGATVATDEVGGLQYQEVKPVVGPRDAAPRAVTDDEGMPQLINESTYQGGAVNAVFNYLTDDGSVYTRGDDIARINMVRNFSDAGEGVTYFYYKPAAGRAASISAIVVRLRDTGALDAASYGNNISLTNGIHLIFGQAADPNAGPVTELFSLTGGLPVITNVDWGRNTIAPQEFSNFGAGDEFFRVPIISNTLNRARRFNGLVLIGDDDHFLGVELNDDFTGLVEHLCFLVGVEGPAEEIAGVPLVGGE